MTVITYTNKRNATMYTIHEEDTQAKKEMAEKKAKKYGWKKTVKIYKDTTLEERMKDWEYWNDPKRVNWGKRL